MAEQSVTIDADRAAIAALKAERSKPGISAERKSEINESIEDLLSSYPDIE